MKKNIIILGLISLLAVSCGDDFLTTHPGDSVSTDLALSTEQDIDNAVNGLYDLMSSYGYYGGTMFFYGDMKGMMMQSYVIIAGELVTGVTYMIIALQA